MDDENEPSLNSRGRAKKSSRVLDPEKLVTRLVTRFRNFGGLRMTQDYYASVLLLAYPNLYDTR